MPSRSATGKRGPITAKLQAAYFGLVQGKTQDKWGWLDYVDMIAPARRGGRMTPDPQRPLARGQHHFAPQNGA
jgi:hypothetical protein